MKFEVEISSSEFDKLKNVVEQFSGLYFFTKAEYIKTLFSISDLTQLDVKVRRVK